MKKVLIILLTFVMILPLLACSTKPQEVLDKPQEVLDVEALIDAIGEVTVTSGEAISKAEKEYSYLSSDDQARVSNHGALLRAKDEYDEIVNKLLVGEWIYSYTAKEDDYWRDYHAGDRIRDTLILYAGGTGETYRYFDRDTTVEKWDIYSISWSLEKNELVMQFSNTTYTYNEAWKINFDEKTITNQNNEDFHKKS